MEALTALWPAVPAAVWWTVATALVIVGFAGTILPVLPGVLLVLAGLALGAWIDGFERVGAWTMAVIAVFAALALITDFVAGLLGAKRIGASRWALIGAAAGTVIGLFMGLIGVLFMPFVGAVAGEYYALRAADGPRSQQALRVGTATWIGMVVGAVAKIAFACLMVGVFLAAMWVG